MKQFTALLALFASATCAASQAKATGDLNGAVSINTLIQILKHPEIQKVVSDKSATLERPEKRLTFKGIRQTSGAVGRCMGCVPTYVLIFESNVFASGFTEMKSCTVTVSEDHRDKFAITEDECATSGLEKK